LYLGSLKAFIIIPIGVKSSEELSIDLIILGENPDTNATPLLSNLTGTLS